MLETAAKKIKIVRPGDNVMVTAPDMDRAKIHAQSLHALYENLKKKKTFIFTTLVTFFSLILSKLKFHAGSAEQIIKFRQTIVE